MTSQALPTRKQITPIAIGAAIVLIAILSFALPKAGRAATILLDRTSPHFPYPFTIQNLMHILFFIGLGELYVRWTVAKRELNFAKAALLPTDDETILQWHDLPNIRLRVAKLFDSEHGFIPALIDLTVLQFQLSRSVDQTMAVFNSQLELIQHRVDLRYGLVRYIAWLVPTLGFIGTVIGLGGALAGVPEDPSKVSMYEIAHTLSVGFDCTMVALAESAVLVYILHIAQEHEEQAVNLAGSYTLKNLINRLYTAK